MLTTRVHRLCDRHSGLRCPSRRMARFTPGATVGPSFPASPRPDRRSGGKGSRRRPRRGDRPPSGTRKASSARGTCRLPSGTGPRRCRGGGSPRRDIPTFGTRSRRTRIRHPRVRFENSTSRVCRAPRPRPIEDRLAPTVIPQSGDASACSHPLQWPWECCESTGVSCRVSDGMLPTAAPFSSTERSFLPSDGKSTAAATERLPVRTPPAAVIRIRRPHCPCRARDPPRPPSPRRGNRPPAVRAARPGTPRSGRPAATAPAAASMRGGGGSWRSEETPGRSARAGRTPAPDRRGGTRSLGRA